MKREAVWKARAEPTPLPDSKSIARAKRSDYRWLPAKHPKGELIDKVVKIRRCAAVVKGGRRFSFTALVVVGDGKGKVGWGYGKANEVPPSVEKAVKDGTRNMVSVSLDGTTIPHESEGTLRRSSRRPGPGRTRYGRHRRRGGASRVRGLRDSRHPHEKFWYK